MKKLAVLVSCLLVCLTFVLGGCGTKLSLPEKNSAILSNGGTVVVIGDYTYFPNIYVSYKNLSGNANTNKTVDTESLYRIKTDINKKLVYNEKDELINLEKVFTKITGFETSCMFAVGNYLYFTSPNVHKSSTTSEDKFDLTSLFRIKFDGSGMKEILTTQTTSGVFYLDAENNLFIFDNNKILMLKIQDSLKSTTTIASDVQTATFPKAFGETINNVYYTKALDEEDTDAGLTGNKLYGYNLESKTESLVRAVYGETVDLVTYSNGRLYYKRTVDGVNRYFSSTVQDSNLELTELAHTNTSTDITGFTPLGAKSDGSILPVIFTYNNKMFIQQQGTDAEVLVEENATPEFVSGDYLYYSTSKGIFKISYKDKVVKKVAEKSGILQGNIDFDGRFVYFFAKEGSEESEKQYMYRADTKTAELGQMIVECISSI